MLKTRHTLLFSACTALLTATTAVAGVPTISNFSNLIVDEQDPASIIDQSIDIANGVTYGDGSIKFSIAGALASDTLSLTSESNVNAAAAISVLGSDVYLGNGAGRDRIGSIDSVDNGQNGAALTINFSSALVNSGFETGDATGWTVYSEQYPDEASVSGDSIPWVQSSGATGTGTVLLANSTSASYTVQTVTSPVSQGNYALQLLLTGTITCSTPGAGQNPDSYCSTHGPYADSTPFDAFSGDQIFVDWAAQNGGDWYEVFGLLIGDGVDDTFGTADDTETQLFSERGDTRTFTPSSATIASEDTYKFRFISGTYDASGGLGVGASLYIDGVRLVGSTAIADSVVSKIAGLITFQNDSDNPPTSARVLTVTATAEDGNSASATADLTINGINDQPTITSNGSGPTATLTTDQNAAVITTFTGADPDSTTLTYSIVPGNDGDLFAINTTSGVLTFGAAPVAAGTHVVEVQISDGDATSTQLITMTVDEGPPVVTPAADVAVDASGLFTTVDLGVASATDVTDGILTPTPDKTGPFAPGSHTITWSATDSAGTTVQAEQTLKVLPLANFARDQIVDDSGSTQVVVQALLNGTAADYPVTIPFTVGGTADNPGDHDLTAGNIVISSGNSGSVTFNVVDDGVGDDGETITLAMGTLDNAATGFRNEHQITLSELNEPPIVSLELDQNGLATNSVAVTGDGNIVATASVTDPNTGDSHSYDWARTNTLLTDIDSADETFTFDPAALTPGLYQLEVVVTDDFSSPLSGNAVINLLIEESAPVLTALTDADGDGIDDLSEGYGDTDNDGVPDYLDAIAESNVLSEQRGNASSFLLETNPGLHLRLGSVALSVGDGASQVSAADVSEQTQIPTDTVENVGGYFDFEVSNIATAGQVVDLVMAQSVQVPANAVYRKLFGGSWSDFTETASDRVASAAGAEGFCPPPGDEAYTDGLTQDHWCVQITIQDGGPNDTDGEANSRVVDPGGVGALETGSLESGTGSGSEVAQVTRRGGSLSFWAIGILGFLAIGRKLRGKGVDDATLLT